MIPKSGPPFTGNAISAQSHGLVASEAICHRTLNETTNSSEKVSHLR
jgi:hypothetical protein